MKGVTGILTATLLGVIAAGCNWLYLHNLAANHATMSFVAVSSDAQLRLGDPFKEPHFVRVDIPRSALGNLDLVAVKWEALASVIGQTANRDYFGGELLLHEDLLTPARRELNTLISGDERVMWLPVDPRSFNPAHLNPGDFVSFKVPDFTVAQPAAADESEPLPPEEIIGPFEILALGDRKGRRDVQRAAGVPAGSENNIAIRVRMEQGNRLEPKAQRIADVLQMTNFKGVQVLLHPAPARADRS